MVLVEASKQTVHVFNVTVVHRQMPQRLVGLHALFNPFEPIMTKTISIQHQTGQRFVVFYDMKEVT